MALLNNVLVHGPTIGNELARVHCLVEALPLQESEWCRQRVLGGLVCLLEGAS